MLIKHKYTKLTMDDGEVYIAKESIGTFAQKMNGLNVGKTVMQPVVEEGDPFAVAQRYVNLFHVKYIDGTIIEEEVDLEPPEIHYDGPDPITVEYGATFNLPDVTVTDNADDDPDLRHEMRNANGVHIPEIDTEQPGAYSLHYFATDASGNASDLSIQVEVEQYVDTTPPEIQYSGDNPIVLEHGSAFTMPTVDVSDTDDPNPTLTAAILDPSGSVTDAVDTTTAGDYKINYTATDRDDNTSTLSITVTVNEYVDDVAPELLYAGANPIELDYDGAFEFPEVTASDNFDPNPAVTHTIEGPDGSTVDSVDTTVSGSYGITFTATDDSGNTDTLTIHVTVADEPEPEPVIRTETEYEYEEIDYETVEEDNNSLPVGETSVSQDGVVGQRTITYEVTYTDDVETDRREISREVTTEPVNEIIQVGTYVEPEPEPEDPEEEEEP